MKENEAFALAAQIADYLSSINGVVCVGLGGSWSQGNACKHSDLDIIIHYYLKNKPSLVALQQVVERLDDFHRAALLSDFGAWGRQWNGGGKLQVEGHRVDIIYSNLEWLSKCVEDSLAGHITTEYMVNSPYGFRNHYKMGYLYSEHVLYDPTGKLASLKAQTNPYPAKLKQAVIRNELWAAGLALSMIESSIARNDIYFVAGFFARCISCLVQVIFALNEHYMIVDKNALTLIATFAQKPENFSKIAAEILAHPGEDSAQLKNSKARLSLLLAECHQQCGEPANQYEIITVPGM